MRALFTGGALLAPPDPSGGAAHGRARDVYAMYFGHFGTARRVLDVGCGAGDLGRQRPSPEVRVHGVDLDPGALALAAATETVVRADLDAGPLPYADGSFDAVLAKDVFEHLVRPERLAREVWRVLCPGGVVVASVVMARPRAVWADYTHVRGFTRRTAPQLLADAGFTVERVWRMGGVPLSRRLGFAGLVPQLLRLPGASQLWASSWELRARKDRDGAAR
ncbi:MAG TPA: methyltransferase domain-containing protein [Actinomycetes bacterium]